MTDLLRVESLRAGFGTNAVLHGVDLRVRAGEISAVLGLNGAGKSVTMKTVAGIVPAWSGTVTLDGRDITRASAEERVALGMGHVPQGRNVFADLSVEQNLRLGAYALRRRDKSRYGEVLERTLARFPLLAKRRGQMAGTMSGGEQAALAVARALMSEPKLLCVDEPSAGLAPIVVRDLRATLREVNGWGVTILLVEQNVSFALEVADSVHVMQRGRIVYEGAVETLDRARIADYLGVGRLLGPHLEAVARQRRPAAPSPTAPG